MNGRKLTAAQRLERRAAWWRRERAKATDNVGRAATAWRQLRGEAARWPAEKQEATWRRVEEFLDAIREQGVVNLTPEIGTVRRPYADRRSHVHARGTQPNTSRKEGSR